MSSIGYKIRINAAIKEQSCVFIIIPLFGRAMAMPCKSERPQEVLFSSDTPSIKSQLFASTSVHPFLILLLPWHEPACTSWLAGSVPGLKWQLLVNVRLLWIWTVYFCLCCWTKTMPTLNHNFHQTWNWCHLPEEQDQLGCRDGER